MLDPDVYHRSVFVVAERIVNFLECVETLYYLSEYRRFAIEIVEIIAQCDNELTTCKALIRIPWRNDRSHTDSTPLGMLQLGMNICHECPLRRPIDDTPYRAPIITSWCARADRIAGLEGEVLLYVVDGGEVVVFDLAQL